MGEFGSGERERVPDYEAYREGLHDGSLEIITPKGRLQSRWRGSLSAVVVVAVAAIAGLAWGPYSYLSVPLALVTALTTIVLLQRGRDRQEARRRGKRTKNVKRRQLRGGEDPPQPRGQPARQEPD